MFFLKKKKNGGLTTFFKSQCHKIPRKAVETSTLKEGKET